MTRIEKDYLGEKSIPSEAYYGIQTLRAKENFAISSRTNEVEMIKSMAKIKEACALANLHAGVLTTKKANAIVAACDKIIKGDYLNQFIVDPIQGGAGTSMNMNANEVIANIANELLGGQKGDYNLVHPNDDVNMAQSTNDVYPTAGKLAVLALIPGLIEQLELLVEDLDGKAKEFHDVFKMGRTQLQDAVPMRLGQSFNAYKTMIIRDIKRINLAKDELKVVNLGATAIGSAINTSDAYLESVVDFLNMVTGEDLVQADDLFDATQNIDSFASVSGSLKNLAINLNKMSNDLRLLSSGPKTGISEINLPAKQNGSSIMPGKVNPVIPEVMNQVAFCVMGNDLTISLAAQNGQLELNAFEPVLFTNLFESITTLTNGIKTLRVNCIQGITANKERCQDLLEESVGIVTALCPYIGYNEAASIAKESLKTNVKIKDLLLEKNIVTLTQYNEIMDYSRLTR